MSSEVKERVSTLEKTLADFIKHTNLGFANVNNSLIELRQEMADFKDEMADFKDEMAEFKDEMAEFKDEMAEFKDEMAEFKDEMRLQTGQLNKKWGELSNRLGTLAEDFAAPNIPYVAQKYFGCTGEAQDFMLRRRRRLPNKSDSLKEFDVIVVYSGYVFYNETKSTPRSQYIDEFVENINQFFKYFPEYKGCKLVPIFSSLALDESVVNNCTKKGIYAMALKGDTMDLLNFENVSA